MAEILMINQLIIKSKIRGNYKNCDRTRRWLHNEMLFSKIIRLSILSNNWVELSKKKELDADPRAIQPIEFCRRLRTNSKVCIVLEKTKEKVSEVYKGTSKICWEYTNGLIQ